MSEKQMILLILARARQMGEAKMWRRKQAICKSCGRRVEYRNCMGGFALSHDTPCKAMHGWLSVYQWQGMGAVHRHDFCSLTCLQNWVDAKVPRVPEVFLKAFGEDKAKRS